MSLVRRSCSQSSRESHGGPGGVQTGQSQPTHCGRDSAGPRVPTSQSSPASGAIALRRGRRNLMQSDPALVHALGSPLRVGKRGRAGASGRRPIVPLRSRGLLLVLRVVRCGKPLESRRSSLGDVALAVYRSKYTQCASDAVGRRRPPDDVARRAPRRARSVREIIPLDAGAGRSAL